MWDFFFFFGGMKPTENFNRYMSVAASKIQQQRLVNRLTNSRTSKRKIAKTERRLKDFYKMTDDNIAMLKKYGT